MEIDVLRHEGLPRSSKVTTSRAKWVPKVGYLIGPSCHVARFYKFPEPSHLVQGTDRSHILGKASVYNGDGSSRSLTSSKVVKGHDGPRKKAPESWVPRRTL